MSKDLGWTNYQLAVLLGHGGNGKKLGTLLNGQQYPSTLDIKKIEVLFGWKGSEQIDLIAGPGEPIDDRWAMVFRHVVEEWKAANPRTVPTVELRSIFPSEGAYRSKKSVAGAAQDRAPYDAITPGKGIIRKV